MIRRTATAAVLVVSIACAWPRPLDEPTILFGLSGVSVALAQGGTLPLAHKADAVRPVNVHDVAVVQQEIFALGSTSLEGGPQFISAFSAEGGWKLVVAEDAWAFTVAPNGRQLVFSKGRQQSPGHYADDLLLFDRTTSSSAVLAEAAVSPTSRISWRPSTNEVWFDRDGQLFALDLDDLSIRQKGQGQSPSWNHMGNQLAFLNEGGRLAILDAETGSTTLLASPAWLQRFYRPISWSHDGSFVTVNQSSGLTGKGIRCVAVRLEDGAKRSFATANQWCGPPAPIAFSYDSSSHRSERAGDASD